jgi:hypothetical protein
MEIEEAAHSGLRVVSYSDINYTELLSNRLPESALQVELWKRSLRVSRHHRGARRHLWDGGLECLLGVIPSV